MPTQQELDDVYMGMARLHSGLSKAVRKKVGSALVTPAGIVLTGYNGTPSGFSNVLEHKVDGTLVTKPEVIHSELNCILKAARQGISVENSILYVTLSPCVACSAMLLSAGIKEVVYAEEYRITDGIDLLKQRINVRKYYD